MIVSPVIDIIDKETMLYSIASPTVRGGFDPSMHFKWDSIPPHELHTRRSPIEPIVTPAIAGGLFAVDREWFHHLGDYDSQMDIWGAENVGMLDGLYCTLTPYSAHSIHVHNYVSLCPLELSLRAWTCGGSMEIIPCSHVGHIFRSAIPYTFGPGGTYHNTVGK